MYNVKKAFESGLLKFHKWCHLYIYIYIAILMTSDTHSMCKSKTNITHETFVTEINNC